MLRISRWSALLISTVPVVVLVWTMTGLDLRAVSEQQTEPAWTPFQAELERIDNYTGESAVSGMLYVDAFGSERRESWATVGTGERRVVEIRNQRTGRFCRLRSSTNAGESSSEWTCQPMDVMPRRPRPAVSEEGPTIEGLATRLARMPSGVELVMAPELSWYPIIRKDDAITTRLSNIQRVTPDPQLFFPPSDATVVELSEKGGQIMAR